MMPTQDAVAIGEDQAVINDFLAKALMLIQMVAEYAGEGVVNPIAESNLRQLRSTTAALNAALMSLPLIMPQPISPVVTSMPLTNPPGAPPVMPKVARPGPGDMLPSRRS